MAQQKAKYPGTELSLVGDHDMILQNRFKRVSKYQSRRLVLQTREWSKLPQLRDGDNAEVTRVEVESLFTLASANQMHFENTPKSRAPMDSRSTANFSSSRDERRISTVSAACLPAFEQYPSN